VEKKNHFIQFLTKNNSFNEWIIEHSNNLITNICSLKFLGIMIDNTLSWKSHIDKTGQVVLQPATQIPLLPNHTETPTHIEPITIRPMW